MGKYQNDAIKLLEFVGGKENVSAVTHCVTRMRFVLNDESKANVSKIESLDSVKGSFTQGGQFQVIIGNDVDLFYNDFVKVSGVEGVSKEEAKSVAGQNQNALQRAMSVLAEIFAPLIPAIITGGLLLGFRNVIGDIAFDSLGGQTLVATSTFWSGVHGFLWLICEAIFHFLPVGICWSITRKMGTTQILGIVLGITLVSGQLLNAYGVATATEIPYWDFGFAKVNMIGYQAQVLPAMFAGFTLVYLERFWKKVIPQAISMIFVPMLSLVPAVIIAHTILGPIGWTLGKGLSSIVYGGLTGGFKVVFAALFGTFYSPVVITGLHHMTNAIDLQMIADFGGTILWPMIALSNIAQGSAVLAIAYLHRGDKKEEQVSIPSMISAYLGVTEPAMFGINIKYLYPFVAAMIGSGLAATFSVANGVEALGIGVGGLPGILSIKSDYWLPFAISMGIAIIVPFVLTILFEKRGLFQNKGAKMETPDFF